MQPQPCAPRKPRALQRSALVVDTSTRGGVTPAHWPRCVVGGKRGGGDGKGSASGDDRSGRQLVMPTAQCDPRDRDSRGTREHTSAFKNTREGAGGRICRCFFKIHMLENSMEMWSRQPRTKRAELCFHLCYLPRALSSHFHSSSWFRERARKVEELGHIRLGPSSRG